MAKKVRAHKYNEQGNFNWGELGNGTYWQTWEHFGNKMHLEHFFDRRSTPEQKLWVAVVWQAIYGAIHGDIDDLEWILCKDLRVYSFEWVCRIALNLSDPDKIRRVIGNKDNHAALQQKFIRPVMKGIK